jgi:hypothetical protein
MPRPIDERYLAVHPATQVWWSQREKCRSCAFLVTVPSDSDDPAMRCKVAPPNRRKNNGRPYGYLFCIDARLETESCGPLAALWKEA